MMPAILKWLKSNVLIVVLAVLTLVLPAAGIAGAVIWNGSIRKGLEDEFKKEKSKFTGAQRVTYVIPKISEDETLPELSRPPNARVSEWVKAERAKRQAEIDAVITRAVGLNLAGRGVLLKGLFPKAENPREERRLVDELLEGIALGEDGHTVYERLFAGVNAGGPADALEVARSVFETAERERDKLADAAGTMKPEDEAALSAKLRDVRLSAAVSRAEELSLYADPVEVLTGVPTRAALALTASAGGGAGGGAGGAPPAGGPAGFATEGFSVVPVLGWTDPAGRPGLAQAFNWQADYWVVEDVLAAVKRANTDDAGLLTETPRSTVKRIDAIRIEALPLPSADAAAAGGADPFSGGGPPSFGGRGREEEEGSYGAPPPPSGRVAGGGGFGADPGFGSDPSSGGGATGPFAPAFTGHASGPENQVYDARRVLLTAVVASERLPRLVRAIGETNLMTVVGMQAQEVDVWSDLAQGYYYGDEHVVRVTLDIETIWLRQWTVDAMPAAVQTALGVQAPVDEVAEEGAQP